MEDEEPSDPEEVSGSREVSVVISVPEEVPDSDELELDSSELNVPSEVPDSDELEPVSSNSQEKRPEQAQRKTERQRSFRTHVLLKMKGP